MKNTPISLFLIVFTTVSVSAQSYVADVSKSTLDWHGKKVTGEHFGNIDLKEGMMIIKNDQITGGKFVIDMTSITNTDLTDASYNRKLVNHLKSDDFFGVEKHPEAVIEIAQSSRFVNNEASVDANLTIKNINHPVTFIVKRNGNDYHAEIVVDRSKYNVRYGSGSFFDNLGDKMIYDDFTIKVKMAIKKPMDEES